MRVTIECYGASSRWCGADEVQLELASGQTANDALDLLAERYPEFAARRDSIAIAIGNAITSPTIPVEDGERIALIPPVSAG
jgi:molybdopterin converting factor small subunit